jgi:hypothetical protein
MTVVSSDSYNSAHHSPFILIVAFVVGLYSLFLHEFKKAIDKTNK